MIAAAASTVLYYLLGFSAVIFAIATVTSPRILRAAIHLMTVLVLSAGFYLLLSAEFLAGVQILVYVGGIVVLLVFAIMLTRSSDLVEAKPSFIRKGVGFLAAVALLLATLFLVRETPWAISGAAPVTDTTAAIGRKLLDRGAEGYLVPFEVISLLLLAAAIGGIVVARKTPARGGK